MAIQQQANGLAEVAKSISIMKRNLRGLLLLTGRVLVSFSFYQGIDKPGYEKVFIMEFSIQGDIFFFYDTLSDEEKEVVRKSVKERYKGHTVSDPKIDDFLEELERDHGIKLKRLPVTSVIAV